MDIADLIVPQLPQQIELRVDFRVAVEQESGWYTKVGCDCADVLYRGVNDLCGSQLLHLSGRDRHPCFRDGACCLGVGDLWRIPSVHDGENFVQPTGDRRAFMLSSHF